MRGAFDKPLGFSLSKGSRMRALSCLAALAVAAVFAGACTNEVGDDAAAAVVVVDDSVSSAAVTYVEPGVVDSTRLYIGWPNEALLTDEAPRFYGHFDMLPRGKVDISAERLDDRRRVTGYKFYRVNPAGSLRLLGVVEARRGVNTVRLESTAGGTFVVEAASSANGLLGIDITCTRRDGQCARQAQPGKVCGGRNVTPCDDGLFCQIDAAQICGRADGTGVCAFPQPICPSVACRTVCGCDGLDYCDTCNAHAVGANVLHDGACEVEEPVCDPAIYERAEGSHNTHGIWTFCPYHPASSMSQDVVATLSLYDGDFHYGQVWNPICPDGYACRMPSRVFEISGGWENQGFAVQLLPDAESLPAPEQLAQSFVVWVNCEGDVQLTTTELGGERTFTRDLCADHSCAENQHCEIVAVQCIQAPCPPQPTCVAN